MPAPHYKPRQLDLDWARNMMKLISEGGTLIYPAAQLIYNVSHKTKTMQLTNEDQLFDFRSFVAHYQTIDVFNEIGYTVLPLKEDYVNKAVQGQN